MQGSLRPARPMMLLIVVFVGWAAFAQVRDPANSKATQSTKGGEPATKPGAAKKAAEPAKSAAAGLKDSEKTAAPTQRKVNEEGAEGAAIRKTAESFVTAYNAHDARAVAELFAPKAEFTDEEGNLIKGRESIQQDFARMFELNPGCKVEIEVASVRVLTPNIAVEEGTVLGRPAPGDVPNVSTYVAVHVKVDGRWMIASVNDYEADSAELSPNDRLQELAWMVGDWIDESAESSVTSSCRWDGSGSYLLHEFSVQIEGVMKANGSMRIGWDPLSKQIKSWTFDVDGGNSEGLWTRSGDEWSVNSRGVNGDGKTTTATNVFRMVDKDSLTWRSYDRVVGGEPSPDVPENLIKRQQPEPNE